MFFCKFNDQYEEFLFYYKSIMFNVLNMYLSRFFKMQVDTNRCFKLVANK